MQAQQGHKGSGSKLDSTLTTPSVDTPPCSLPTQRAAVRLHAPQTCARARHVLRACRETASGQHPGRRRRPRRRPAAAGRSTPARHQRPPRRPATRPPLPRPGPEPDMCCTLKPAALRCQRRHKHPTQTSKFRPQKPPSAAYPCMSGQDTVSLCSATRLVPDHGGLVLRRCGTARQLAMAQCSPCLGALRCISLRCWGRRLPCARRPTHRAPERGSSRAQRRGGLRFRLPRQDERAARLQDAGLGRRDLAQAAAQRGLPAGAPCRQRASSQQDANHAAGASDRA